MKMSDTMIAMGIGESDKACATCGDPANFHIVPRNPGDFTVPSRYACKAHKYIAVCEMCRGLVEPAITIHETCGCLVVGAVTPHTHYCLMHNSAAMMRILLKHLTGRSEIRRLEALRGARMLLRELREIEEG